MAQRIILSVWLVVVQLTACAFEPTPDPFEARVDHNDPNAYNTIAAALKDAPASGTRPFRISIAAGDYFEKLVINKPNIQLLGSGQHKTRLFYNAYAGQRRSKQATASSTHTTATWTTWESATLIVRAPDFTARDMLIENSFDYRANDRLPKGDPRKVRDTQAVAVMTDHGSDRALFERVTLSGFQDTLFTLAGRSLFRHCTIKGHVDFIFGAGTAVFQDTDIVTRSRPHGRDPIGYVTAPSTHINSAYGLVFIHSRLLREPGVRDESMALGRPWHPTTNFPDGRYADPRAIGQAVFINCWMDAHIKRNAWYAMSGKTQNGSPTLFQPQDARLFEFASRGPGAHISENRRQLSAIQAQPFTLNTILSDWRPPAYIEHGNATTLAKEPSPFSIARESAKHKRQYPSIKAIDPHTPDKGFDAVIAHRNLVYRRTQQHALQLDLFRPVNAKASAAAVVLIHGGAWRTGNRSHQIPLARALAQAGYVGVAVDYRLSSEALYPAGIHDIQAAIRWLRSNGQKYGVNPRRIAVLGASSGAHMATLIGSVGHLPQFASKSTRVGDVGSDVQAIINLDGVVDLAAAEARVFEDKPGKVSYAGLWLGGRYAENPRRWLEASALQYAGKHTPPTLFINSSHDRFHVGRDQFMEVLRHHGTLTEALTLPNTPHSFWLFHPWFDVTRNHVIQFLDKVFEKT